MHSNEAVAATRVESERSELVRLLGTKIIEGLEGSMDGQLALLEEYQGMDRADLVCSRR